MGRRNWMQGPAPVNIGGTGRRRRKRPGSRRAPDSKARCDGGRHETGRTGEEMALEYLLQRGYKLLDRNWRCRYKEVDLIMKGADGLHIVEVRTRRAPTAVEPEQTVDRWKRRNLEAAANSYLRSAEITDPVHFDIVSIVLDGSGRVLRLSHIPDAFLAIDL